MKFRKKLIFQAFTIILLLFVVNKTMISVHAREIPDDISERAKAVRLSTYKYMKSLYSDDKNEDADLLSDLITKYTGTYWTIDGKKGNLYGTTSHRYYNGIQCKGFACYIFDQLYENGYIGATDSKKYCIPKPKGAYELGKKWGYSSTNVNTVKNLLSKAKVGDFIQARIRGKSYGHSMIVAGKTKDGLKIFDCNVNDNGMIKCYQISWKSLTQKYIGISLYRSDNSDKTNKFLNVSSSANGSVKLSWNKVPSVDGYFIYYKKIDSKKYTYVGRTTARNYTLKNLAQDKIYTFRIVPYKLHNGKRIQNWYKIEKTFKNH